MTHSDEIKSHYSEKWANVPVARRWHHGPISELPLCFCVLEFAPTIARGMWAYATCCMSQPSDSTPIELHLFSPAQCELHVELLTAIAHYHRTGRSLGLGHTVNFGRPWMAGSQCEYGLISRPYLDGPSLEQLRTRPAGQVVRCLWLVPITERERNYKRTNGLEALEQVLEQSKFDYLDPVRTSVV